MTRQQWHIVYLAIILLVLGYALTNRERPPIPENPERALFRACLLEHEVTLEGVTFMCFSKLPGGYSEVCFVEEESIHCLPDEEE